jgi:hypothetical protein
LASSRFWRRKKGDDERLSPPGDAGDNADRTEDLEEEDNRGEEVNGEGGEVTGPDGDGAPSSFFDMSAEEAARYVPPGTVVARKEPFDPKPILLCFLAALVVAGVAAAVVLLWPSSHTSVPDLTGVRLAEAMKEARSRGFEPEVTGWEFSGEHEDGVVIKQRPGADERVEKGGALTLTVSKGPEPGHDRSLGLPDSFFSHLPIVVFVPDKSQICVQLEIVWNPGQFGTIPLDDIEYRKRQTPRFLRERQREADQASAIEGRKIKIAPKCRERGSHSRIVVDF